MTKISVVIPAHRCDDWLDEAVNSVLNSKDVPFKIVVVLNGIASVPQREWMASPNVEVLHFTDPLGPTLAMIRGVEASESEFIARLDADDRTDPRRLEKQLRYLESHPDTPLVGTMVQRIAADGAPAGEIRMPSGTDVRKHLVLSNTVPHSTVLMRRDAFSRVGGYDPELSQMEDYELILRLAQEGPISVLPEVLVEYRLHTGQVSKGAKPKGVHINKVIKQRARLGKMLGMSTIGIWARNFLWRAIQFTRYYGVTKPGHEY